MKSPTSTRINKFYKNTKKVFGWLNYEDALFFDFFLNTLNAKNVPGAVLEIGAHFGKTSILLGNYVQSPKNLYVCDVFDKTELLEDCQNLHEYETTYRSIIPTRNLFEDNFAKHHKWLPVIYQVNSLNLHPYILNKQFKFIHIDGGHTFQAVKSDMELALNKISHNGIVVMDDYRSYGAIGVSTVFWSTIFNKQLNLVLLTDAKAYFTSGDDNFYLDSLEHFLKKEKIVYSKPEINNNFFLQNSFKMGKKKHHVLKLILPPILYKYFSKVINKII
jgi:predicted O-methyltransferase YrrM